MARQVIRLPRGEWSYDDDRPLGSEGGFGQVFEGTDQAGNPVAVKRLKITAAAAAHRELAIAAELVGRDAKNVLIPLDSGQDANSDRYFVVMPRADRSLDDLLRAGTPGETASVEILLHIARGLHEVMDIVHRDLKPANVLEREVWQIADFGIARFVEDTTSLNTLKECLTPQFAAPEQWSMEQATHATDVYALGCIAHVLLSGEPPFSGTVAELRRQHLTAAAPPLPGIDPRLAALIAACLRKPATGRPEVARILTILRDIQQRPRPASAVVDALRSANAKEVDRAAVAAAEAERVRAAQRERNAIVETGLSIMTSLIGALDEAVRQNAGEARIERATQFVKLRLGSAELVMQLDGPVPPGIIFESSKWEPFALGQIEVIQGGRNAWEHGATLWYMRLAPNAPIRWYEVSYKYNAFVQPRKLSPFPIQELPKDAYKHADLAAGSGMHTIELVGPPTPIDDEHESDFIERWIARLVSAYDERLRPF